MEQATNKWQEGERCRTCLWPPGHCPAGHKPKTTRLDSHLELGDLADVGGNDALGPDVTGSEHAQRPRPGGGEEPEAAVLAERHLGDEFAARVEQARVADGHSGPVLGHMALHDRLGAGILGRAHRCPACRGAAAVNAHLPSPPPTGTPTREPYSVQDPS